MLALSRRIGERVVLTDSETGRRIVVTVLRDRRFGGIKLGFDAPREVTIMREELVEHQLGVKHG